MTNKSSEGILVLVVAALAIAACEAPRERCAPPANGDTEVSYQCGGGFASWSLPQEGRPRVGLPVQVALSREAISAGYFDEYRRAGDWFNHQLRHVLPDGQLAFIVNPAVDTGGPGLEEGQELPGDVYVDVADEREIPYGRTGWTWSTWDLDTCGMGQVSTLVSPNVPSRLRFGLVAHELAHAAGLEHRRYSDVVSCVGGRRCADEASCDLLPEEVADLEQTLLGR